MPKESELSYTSGDWLQMSMSSQSENVRNNTLMVLWQAWNLRNNLVHGDRKHTVSNLVRHLIKLKEDLLLTAGDSSVEGSKNKQSLFPVKNCKPASPMSTSWSGPEPGRAKLNCDAAFSEDTGQTWGGAVARDHKGHVFFSVGRRLARCSSAEEAEGAVAIMGLAEFSKLFVGQLVL